jgi:hypothetical protein
VVSRCHGLSRPGLAYHHLARVSADQDFMASLVSNCKHTLQGNALQRRA